MRFTLLSYFTLLILSLVSIHMAEAASPPESKVHIVYTEQPKDEEPEAYHIRTLSSVVGSEDAAKEALIYSYKTAASGFSAKLTTEQVAEMQKQPGVLQVVQSRALQLHSGTGMRAGPAILH
ncbi:subtilisin-like protease SBT3.11 isoform X1 [Tripterygium wilfordii]|uniref:subtilisin-like protease SBT3.11 isoform X1 n=1 Tax=Tripterygium wilfordii TaxID=458696 RepID=UPI0018F7F279|nr:subtilisin-like protease SBT3.11 isoform X1 [Tripterygium wilfordii]